MVNVEQTDVESEIADDRYVQDDEWMSDLGMWDRIVAAIEKITTPITCWWAGHETKIVHHDTLDFCIVTPFGQCGMDHVQICNRCKKIYDPTPDGRTVRQGQLYKRVRPNNEWYTTPT